MHSNVNPCLFSMIVNIFKTRRQISLFCWNCKLQIGTVFENMYEFTVFSTDYIPTHLERIQMEDVCVEKKMLKVDA